MKFTPSLQRLLQLRRSLERQEEMKLSLLAARRQAAEQDRERERECERREQVELLDGLRDRLSGAELQAAGLRHAVDTLRTARLQAEAEQAAVAQAGQRQIWLERTRERETLSTLAAQCHEQEVRERRREDQAALDEAFLLDPARPRGGQD
ncbi:MAG: hypothetical protein ACRD1Y_03140 [Terriglobales bacterium]